MRLWLLLFSILIMPWAQAGEAKPKTDSAQSPLQQLLDEQGKWAFEPPPRTDVFIDIAVMLSDKKNQAGNEAEATRKTEQPGQNKDKTLSWGKQKLADVESLVLQRKWDDAMKHCESSIKILTRYADDAEFTQIIERLKRYYNQADEAKTYEEAQAKFDALGLKVEGILWSPTASMAIIGGEPRALKLNDRVKDCVIINIDTNRVDFLFHYNRKRFEFQRYVGEDAKAGVPPAGKK